MKAICSLLTLIARLCIAAIFLFAGIGKLLDAEGTAQFMASKGVPYVPYALYVAAAVEIIGALMLIIGFKTRFAAFVLILFLIPTTYFIHNFWDVSDTAARTIELTNFLKNLAIFGGLLYVLCHGCGGCGCDRCGTSCSVKKPNE